MGKMWARGGAAESMSKRTRATKALATWEDALYPRPFSRWIKADAARTRIAGTAGSSMLGDRMQTATSSADPAIGAVSIPLGVSELELARIDADARARAEDVRERLAQCQWKSAPGLMARECAHESRAAR